MVHNPGEATAFQTMWCTSSSYHSAAEQTAAQTKQRCSDVTSLWALVTSAHAVQGTSTCKFMVPPATATATGDNHSFLRFLSVFLLETGD